jgi:hypothetical protein
MKFKMNEETIEINYNDKPKQLAEQIIKMLRNQQKEYSEGQTTVSGLAVAQDMVQQGAMTVSLLIHLRQAVINYDTPFKIVAK